MHELRLILFRYETVSNTNPYHDSRSVNVWGFPLPGTWLMNYCDMRFVYSLFLSSALFKGEKERLVKAIPAKCMIIHANPVMIYGGVHNSSIRGVSVPVQKLTLQYHLSYSTIHSFTQNSIMKVLLWQMLFLDFCIRSFFHSKSQRNWASLIVKGSPLRWGQKAWPWGQGHVAWTREFRAY
jgi:hypothetical protein